MGYRQSTHDVTMHYAQLQHYQLFQFKCNLIYTINHFILKDTIKPIQIQIILYTDTDYIVVLDGRR